MRSIKINSDQYDSQFYIKAFLQFQLERGVTMYTIKQHGYALKALHGSPNQMPDENDLRRCLAPARGSASFNKRLTTYHQFFQWLIGLGRTINDPTKNYRYKKKQYHFVGQEDCNVVKLLEGFDKSTFAGYRDFVMTVLILDTGMRPSEVIGIKESDVNLKSKEIFLSSNITKTRVERVVPFSDKSALYIQKFMSFKLQEWHDTPLFCSSDGKALPPTNFRSRLKRVCLKQGVNITPYELRHIFATTYIRKGGDLFSLQRILGHSSPRMTAIYVNLSTEDLHKKHEQVSVLNNFLNTKNRLGKIH